MVQLAPHPLDRPVGAPIAAPAGRGADVPLTAPELASSPWLRAARVAGTVGVALGVLGVVAWPLHWTKLLTLGGGRAPMTVNTSLATVFAGLAVVLATRRPASVRLIRALGALVLAEGAAVIVEYATRWDLHVDTLVLRPHGWPAGSPPGRLALNTAVCFVAIGAGLVRWSPRPGPRRDALSCGAAIASGSITLVALVGYLAGVPAATGFGRMTMALPTAVLLSALTVGLLMLGVEGVYRRKGRVGEWLSALAGVAAVVVTGLVWRAILLHDGPTVRTATASRGVLAVALAGGLLLALTARLAQRAHRRHQKAAALAAELEQEIRYRCAVEREANEKERILFQILDALPVGVFITRPDLEPYFANRLARELLPSLSGAATEPDRFLRRLGQYVAGTDEHYPPERSPLVRAAAGESSHQDDIEIRSEERSVLLETWGTPVRDADGEVILAMDVIVDIGERRAAERATADQAALLDLSQDAIFVTDPDRTIRYWSLGAERMYGYTRDEAVGRPAHELIGSRPDASRELIDAQLRSHGCWVGELTSQRRDGERLDGLLQCVARFDEQDEIASLLVIVTDVGPIKAAHHELQERAYELERVNLELQRSNDDLLQFAYAASHDLAEPLRAISGPVSLLARRYRGTLDAEADELIDFAVDGCARMQTLIDDLLRFSRVGRLNSGRGRVDTAELVATVQADLRAVVAECGAVVSVSPELPIVWGTASELRQVFQNLLANALKFAAPDRRPEVGIDVMRSGATWVFSVTDNGIGVEPRYRERIFGMFKRLHTRDQYPGTGIGLALVKKIVERHGGSVGVETGPSEVGCRFWFSLPVGDRGPR